MKTPQGAGSEQQRLRADFAVYALAHLGDDLLVRLLDLFAGKRVVVRAIREREGHGLLALADADGIAWYRKPLRKLGRETEFDVRKLESLPRVDIVYTYAGADGAAVEAFVAAGAQGLVSAGFAPSFVTPAMGETMTATIKAGTPVAASTRAGSGRVFYTTRMQEAGFVNADNLNPQKARILLMLGLTMTKDRAELNRIFAEY